jgi:hypothetical protein
MSLTVTIVRIGRDRFAEWQRTQQQQQEEEEEEKWLRREGQALYRIVRKQDS